MNVEDEFKIQMGYLDKNQNDRLLDSSSKNDGCKEWNEWRGKNPDELVFLDGATLENVNLREVNLQGAYLRNANFSGADLVGSNFCGSRIQDANFSGASLHLANLTGTRGNGSTKFNKAELFKADLRDSKIVQGDFSRANLEAANCWGADLRVAKFLHARLEDANFSEAKLESANFRKAYCRNTNFSNSDLKYSKIINVVLTNANFRAAYLFGAKLDGSDLTDCRGYKLDANSIKSTIFAPMAKDPYSVLRRTYTGTMFTLVLFFTMFALAPFAFKAISYSLIGKFQSDYLAVDCNNSNAVEFTCERILAIVLGFTEDSDVSEYSVFLTLLVIFYNVVRFVATVGLSGIREAEERSHHAPAWKSYKNYHLVHQYFLKWFLYGVLVITLWRIGNVLWTPIVIPV